MAGASRFTNLDSGVEPMMVRDTWAGLASPLSQFVAAETESALNAYRARPDLIREHSNIEAAISQGGYGRKQLNELIQNAADAIKEPGGASKIVLTQDALYCANEGQPFTEAGFRTLMLSHSSEKRDDEIGRFGLGFKSVIQVTDEPQIFSRSGSVSWSQDRSRGIAREPVSRSRGLPHSPHSDADRCGASKHPGIRSLPSSCNGLRPSSSCHSAG